MMKFAALLFLCAFPIASASRSSVENGECAYNTYMCCWTENDGQGMQDNTDVCAPAPRDRRMLQSPLSSSTSVTEHYEKFGSDNEGDVHCHGFVWADGAHLETYVYPLMKFVKTYDHIEERGYFGKVPGGPACGCIEKMPIVSRADCTTFSPQGLVACENNDLRTHYDNEMQSPGGPLTENLVGTCPNE